MKKIFTLVLFSAFLMSCVGIESVVDNSIEKTYSNPLIVITYADHSIERFSQELKENMEFHFGADEKEVDILIFDLCQNSMTLNAEEEMKHKIDSTLINDGKDLKLYFEPTTLYFNQGSLKMVQYTFTGLDTDTNKEVWKANFGAYNGPIGKGLSVKTSARKIYEKMKSDKIL